MADATSLRRLGSDTLIYGFGIIVNRIVSFLLLPLYTHKLTPSEYGLAQLLGTAADVTAIVFMGGATAGVARFYFARKDRPDQRAVFSTGFVLSVGLALLGGLALYLTAPIVWEYGLRREGSVTLVHLTALNFFLGSLGTLPSDWIAVTQRPKLSITVSLCKLVVQVGFNILLLVHFEMGVAGVLVSTALSQIFVSLILVPLMLKETGWSVEGPLMRDLWIFGRPYQISAAGSWILTYGDRFFLQAYHGPATIGIYGLAYNFGFLLTQLTATPFIRAWTPQRFQLAHESREVRDPRFAQALFYLMLLMSTGAIAITSFVAPTLEIMTTPAYYTAAVLVPPILFAYVIQAWSEVGKFHFDQSGRPSLFAVAQIAGVGAVLIAYWLMIKPWGAAGAAWATLIGFGIRQLVVWRLSQQVYPVDYQTTRLWRLLALAVPFATIPWLAQGLSRSAQVGLGIVGLGLWIGSVWAILLVEGDRRDIRRFVSQRLAAVR